MIKIVGYVFCPIIYFGSSAIYTGMGFWDALLFISTSLNERTLSEVEGLRLSRPYKSQKNLYFNVVYAPLWRPFSRRNVSIAFIPIFV